MAGTGGQGLSFSIAGIKANVDCRGALTLHVRYTEMLHLSSWPPTHGETVTEESLTHSRTVCLRPSQEPGLSRPHGATLP